MTVFTRIIGNGANTKVLDYLLDWEGLPFSMQDVVDATKLTRKTAHKALNLFMNEQIVVPAAMKNRTKLYVVNRKNRIAKALINLNHAVLAAQIDKIKRNGLAGNKNGN